MTIPLKLDDSKRDELRGTFGPALYIVESDEGDDIVFRKPTPAEYKRFKATALDENKRMHADDNLVRDVVVFPDPKTPEFSELVTRLPALPTALSKQILKTAGYTEGLEAKKL